MSADTLLDALPDLVLLVRRDGTVLDQGGGRGLPGLEMLPNAIGKPLETLFQDSAAELLRALIRKAIKLRSDVEARFAMGQRRYEARVGPRGPERALCVIRPALGETPSEEARAPDARAPQLDRRDFLRRFRESLALAALRETAIAIAVIELDGLTDIREVMTRTASEQVLSAAVLRIAAPGEEGWWYLGELGEAVLALVMESPDRDAIEGCVIEVCASLGQPIRLGDAEFHLTPFAGIARLGQDASSPRSLLDHARAAAAEARRSGTTHPRFFSDTLRLRSLARLDVARELKEAITHRHIRLRYIGRYELATGRQVAWIGYVRWMHPLKGAIRPAEFLRVAEATGLATDLSRAVLAALHEDFTAARARGAEPLRVSFGALRHHVLHEHFARDIEQLLNEGGLPAAALELRIGEKTFLACEPARLRALRALGVELVVDEVGREMASLDRLARAPLSGMQLDRAWVTALCTDEIAGRVCRAGLGVASALGLTPIATGVDEARQRDALLRLGCLQGSGDLFGSAADIIGGPEATGTLGAL